tara:strand:+ start:717 stop:929 length:213 start_codon:yes stop_codon:yes gene_type:complete
MNEIVRQITEKVTYSIGDEGQKTKSGKLIPSINKIPTTEEPFDDFICFHMRDGSSIASSGGVTVIGKKLK